MRRQINRYLLIAALTTGFASTLSASMPKRAHAYPAVASVDTADVDSLALLLRKLEPKVAPVTATIDSMVGVLRVDSGTIRADSAFMRARNTLEQLVRKIRTYDDSAFQGIAFPVGPRRGREPPAPRDLARRDSLERNLEARGIWVYRAEGDAYLAVSESTLFRRLGRFLTEAMQQYQRILIEEQASPTGEDASLMISWDDLGGRLARTDRFLTTYPDAAARDEVKSLYDAYLRWYMLASDNTRTFDRRTRVLDLEVHRSYERYASDHASTQSGRIIRGYLEVLRRNGFRYGDAVRKYILATTDWSHVPL